MQLDLSTAEAAILAEVLDSALGEVREEVYKAEVAEYKDRLREREAAITNLLAQLRSTRPV
jgi:hypothetical protein